MTDSHDHDPAALPPPVSAPVTPAPPVTPSFARVIRRPGPPPPVVPPVVPAPAAVDPVRPLIRPVVVPTFPVPPDTAAAILSGLRAALGLPPAAPVVPPPWWRRGLLGRLHVSLDLRDWALPVGAYFLRDAAGFGVLCLWVRYRRDNGDD